MKININADVSKANDALLKMQAGIIELGRAFAEAAEKVGLVRGSFDAMRIALMREARSWLLRIPAAIVCALFLVTWTVLVWL